MFQREHTIMAIYSTFFVCGQQELSSGFPGWRPRLPKPVRRKVKNPFTGEMTTIETRTPEWSDEEESESLNRGYQIVVIEGNYEDYLEGRLRPFIRARPHWCAKGFTQVELNPLGQAVGIEPALEDALFSPPSSGALLQQLRPDLLSKLLALDKKGVKAIGEHWAATMSTPRYTHSVTGKKISAGWSAAEAMAILEPILEIAQQVTGQQGMYLLIEA
jgi:hypothetical protein